MAALVGLPLAIALGIAVFSPLGPDAALDYGMRAGLVAAIVGGMATALFGGVPLLISGPRAAGALILMGLVKELVGPDVRLNSQLIPLVVAACVGLSGGLQLLAYKLNLTRGILSLPKPVVSGFTLVIGILIVLDQIYPMLLGAFKPSPEAKLVDAFANFDALSVVLAGTILAVYLITANPNWLNKKSAGTRRHKVEPLGPFLAILAGALLAMLFACFAADWGLAAPPTLAQATKGFDLGDLYPAPHYLALLDHLSELWPIAGKIFWASFILALINSVDSLTTAESKRKEAGANYRPDIELLGQGFGNVLSALAGGIGLAATPPRTDINIASGGRTRLAGVFSALAIALAVTLLVGYTKLLPLPMLAALVAAMGAQMVVNNFGALWPQKQKAELEAISAENSRFQSWRDDFAARRPQVPNAIIVWLMLFLGPVFSQSTQLALGAGLLATVALWLRQTSDQLVFRHYSGMERRSLEQRSPENQRLLKDSLSCIHVLELHGDLFFVNALKMREALQKKFSKRSQEKQYLVIDFSRVHEIDMTSAHSLAVAIRDLHPNEENGVKIWLSYVSDNPSLLGPLRVAINPDLTRTPLLLPDERWTSDTEAALEAIEDDILADNANQSGNSIAWHDILKLEDVEPAALESFQKSYLQPFAVDAGCVLYEPKQPAGCLYLLGSGDVRLLMCPSEQKDDVKGTNGTEMDEKPDPRTRRYKRLAALNPGAIFGVDALVGLPAARQTRAISHTESSGWTLEVHFLSSAEITHPEVVRALYKLMAVEVTQRLSAAAHELLLVDA